MKSSSGSDDFTEAPIIGDVQSKFFAVDRRAWASVCKLGNINCAVSYLVMASGSQKNHRTTSWSTNSIEAHTGVSRHLAKAAIETLMKAGLVLRTQDGSRPRYYLQPAHEVPGCEGFPLPDPENKWQADLLSGLRSLPAGKCFSIKSRDRDRVWLDGLVRLGLAYRNGDEFTAVPYDTDAASRPDWIWLPTSLVFGVANEEPPIELLRQSQNLSALRLFIDLYYAQSLVRHGGIHWRQLRQGYRSTRLGEHGAHVVWGFIPVGRQIVSSALLVGPHFNGKASTRFEGHDQGWEIFFDALDLITSVLGLAEFVGHVVEADTDTASVLFPFATDTGEPEERAIGKAAHAAGLRMLFEDRIELVGNAGMSVAPILKHYGAPALVGLLRLRYQPRTEVTTEWLSRKPRWVAKACEFDQLATTPRMQHQMGIKS